MDLLIKLIASAAIIVLLWFLLKLFLIGILIRIIVAAVVLITVVFL